MCVCMSASRNAGTVPIGHQRHRWIFNYSCLFLLTSRFTSTQALRRGVRGWNLNSGVSGWVVTRTHYFAAIDEVDATHSRSYVSACMGWSSQPRPRRLAGMSECCKQRETPSFEGRHWYRGEGWWEKRKKGFLYSEPRVDTENSMQGI